MISKLVKNVSLLSGGLLVGALLGANVAAFAERTTGSPLALEKVQALSKAFILVKSNYVETVEDKKLLEGALNGMLNSLDPHSSYLNEEAYKELTESVKGEFGGLGMQVDLDERTGVVRVTAPIEDTPAFKAGIKPGDLIIKIDNESVQGLTLEQAVKRLRGAPKTQVQITVLRKGEGKPLVYKLTRDVINVKSVKFQLAEADYGYVRITQFQEKTTSELNKALQTLYTDNKGPLKGLVIDLRNNGGGSLYSAVGVSAAFLPKDQLVVYTDGRLPDAKREFFTNRLYYANHEEREKRVDPLEGLPAGVKSVPVVVLINGYSASASEIVAGALQDNKRAIIVGTRSFGKGSVQTLLPLDEKTSPTSADDGKTAIKLTTSRYFTPAKRSIQNKGITPDVLAEETGEDGEVINDRLVTEADLAGHLSNPDGDEEKTPAKETEKPAAKSDSDARTRKARQQERDENGNPVLISKNDTQLKQAFTVLKVQQLLLSKPAAAK